MLPQPAAPSLRQLKANRKLKDEKNQIEMIIVIIFKFNTLLGNHNQGNIYLGSAEIRVF